MDLPYPVAAEGRASHRLPQRPHLLRPRALRSRGDVTGRAADPRGDVGALGGRAVAARAASLRTMRFEQAFFYARAQGAVAFTEAAAPGPEYAETSGLPAVGALLASRSPTSGRFPAIPAPSKPQTPAEVRPGDAGAHTEADALFAVLEWASRGVRRAPRRRRRCGAASCWTRTRPRRATCWGCCSSSPGRAGRGRRGVPAGPALAGGGEGAHHPLLPQQRPAPGGCARHRAGGAGRRSASVALTGRQAAPEGVKKPAAGRGFDRRCAPL